MTLDMIFHYDHEKLFLPDASFLLEYEIEFLYNSNVVSGIVVKSEHLGKKMEKFYRTNEIWKFNAILLEKKCIEQGVPREAYVNMDDHKTGYVQLKSLLKTHILEYKLRGDIALMSNDDPRVPQPDVEMFRDKVHERIHRRYNAFCTDNIDARFDDLMEAFYDTDEEYEILRDDDEYFFYDHEYYSELIEM